jgi:hypothetical protein
MRSSSIDRRHAPAVMTGCDGILLAISFRDMVFAILSATGMIKFRPAFSILENFPNLSMIHS